MSGAGRRREAGVRSWGAARPAERRPPGHRGTTGSGVDGDVRRRPGPEARARRSVAGGCGVKGDAGAFGGTQGSRPPVRRGGEPAAADECGGGTPGSRRRRPALNRTEPAVGRSRKVDTDGTGSRRRTRRPDGRARRHDGALRPRLPRAARPPGLLDPEPPRPAQLHDRARRAAQPGVDERDGRRGEPGPGGRTAPRGGGAGGAGHRAGAAGRGQRRGRADPARARQPTERGRPGG